MKTSVSRAVFMALSTASIAAMTLAGSAYADRQGAPIRYAGQTPNDPSPALTQPAVTAPATSGGVQVTDNRRIQFQYPGQAAPAPAMTDVVPAPSQMILKPVTSAPAVATAATSVATSPLALPSPASSAPSAPIRIASVQTQKPVTTGKPLTLSRVSVDRDAPIGEERGRAGIYTDGFDGQPTANGEIFDETAMTAAHPSLPLPSLVQVTNEDNGREVVVRVNDRGPFDGQRVAELSPRAGSVLGIAKGGSANVRIRYLGPAPVKQVDDSYVAAEVESDSLPPVVASAPVVLAAPAPVLTAPTPAPAYTPPVYEAPRQAEPVQVSTPTGYGNVFIQAGSFADIANAQRLTSALGRGNPVKIEEARVNGGDYFRVLIGPFPNRQAAELHRAQLSNAGIVNGFLTIR